MDATEIKLLELTQAVCRFHRYAKYDASDAIEMLAQEGFENVSVEFVCAIYKQLEKEAYENTKMRLDSAENKLYYAFINDNYKYVALLSERYCVLYERISTDPHVHELELFDLFNDKSV
jgi:hypothetical protein